MKLHPIQNSFEAGEISPRLLGRSESVPYTQGLSLLNNMIVDSRGPVRSRSGTQHRYEFDAPCARLETFQVGADAYFNIIFTPGLITVTSLTGAVAKHQAVVNYSFLQGGTAWIANTSGDASVAFSDGAAHLDSGSGVNVASIRQQVSLVEGNIPLPIIVSQISDPGTQYDVKVGTTAGGNDLLQATTSLAVFEGEFNLGVAGPGFVWVEVGVAAGNVTNISEISVPESSEVVTLDTEYSCLEIPDLYFVQAPGGEAVYILHPTIRPHKVLYDDESGLFTIEAVTFTSLPPEWGPATRDSSWPGVGTIFQGRLWLMATHNEKESMWGSKSGFYEDFTVSDPVVADDAILNVPMEHYGPIKWAMGTKRLVVGTSNGEYVITSSDGLIRPTDIQILRQSTYGSKGIRPLQVNDQILFVSSDGRKVRSMQYSERADNWIAEDMLFISEHISKGEIVEFDWAPNPDNLLWCRLANGDFISCTYERNNNVLGWSRHETNGKFASMAVGEKLGVSILNILAIRADTSFVYEILLPPRQSPELDSSVSKENATPFTTVDGLGHLEGLVVQVIANGAVHPDRTVVGGSITLNKEYFIASVGLGYGTKMVTLPFDKGSATGSGASHFKQYNKIIARVLDSAKPKINGDRPPTRNPSTPMNTAEEVRTEDIEVANLGWDRTALVTIEQDLPLPLTVIALFGEIGQESF